MGIPAPNKDAQNGGDFAPFLKVTDIKRRGKTKLTVLGCSGRLVEGQFGTQFPVDVKLGTKVFQFMIKLNSGNHTRLFDRFGKNEKKWKGPLEVEVGEYLGNEYIKISD